MEKLHLFSQGFITGKDLSGGLILVRGKARRCSGSPPAPQLWNFNKWVTSPPPQVGASVPAPPPEAWAKLVG